LLRRPLTPSKENPLRHSTVLIVLSLLNALFFWLHLTGDIVFGIEKGGREILVGVLILAVYLHGAVGLPERLAGYIILLLGGLASAALPVVHTMGRPLGERFAQLPGGFFFIWTLLTSGRRGSSPSPCPCRQSGASDSAGVLPRNVAARVIGEEVQTGRPFSLSTQSATRAESAFQDRWRKLKQINAQPRWRKA
jgi:hypothetical protein